MKTCTKCKEIKDTDCFYKNQRQPDGFHTWCKYCASNYNKSYRAKNKEILRQKQLLRSAKTAKECNKRAKQWYENNKDKKKKL